MTTRVTIKNENDGIHATWDVELIGPEGRIEHTLKPGESAEMTLWHDGRALTVCEKPKGA